MSQQALQKFDAKESAEKCCRYHRAARNAASQAVSYALLIGEELCRARANLGHGEWLPYLQQSGITPDTAGRYQELAARLQSRLAKFRTVRNLLEIAPVLMDSAQSAALNKVVTKATDGRSLTQLYIDFGIVKNPVTGNGGPKDAKPEAAQGDSEEQAAIDLWKPLIRNLIQEREHKSYAHLPRAERNQLAELLSHLAADVRLTVS